MSDTATFAVIGDLLAVVADPTAAARHAELVKLTARVDVAEAALYFAGERSRYVTGTVLPVDGGVVAGKPIRRRSESRQSD